MLIVGGLDEILVDSVRVMAKRLVVSSVHSSLGSPCSPFSMPALVG